MINKPVAASIQELLKTRRMWANVVEAVGDRASLVLTGGSRLSNVRVIGGSLSAGERVQVEWNGYEPVVYVGGASGEGGAVSQVALPMVGGPQIPSVDPLTEAGWLIGLDGTIYTGQTFIHPDGRIQLGANAATDIWLDATVPSISMGGASAFDGQTAGTGIWMGRHTDGSYRFRVGDPNGPRLSWDGGQLMAAGWVLDANQIQSANGDAGMRSTVGGTQWRFWAGSSDPASAPFRVASDGSVTLTNATITSTLRSANYVSGGAGWQIHQDGSAEFSNVIIRGELRTAVFVKGLIEAHAGTLFLGKSAGILSRPMVAPASGTWEMYVKAPPIGGNLFSDQDILQVIAETPAGVNHIWFRVNTGTPVGSEQMYTCTYLSGTRSFTYPVDAPVADWGASGQSVIVMSADNTMGATTHITMFSHTGAPWSTRTPRLRIGHLNGAYGTPASAWGIGIGDFSTSKYMVYDGSDLVIRGTVYATNGSFSGAITATSGSLGTLSVNGTLTISASGKIVAGATTIDNTGIKIETGAIPGGVNSIRFIETGMSVPVRAVIEAIGDTTDYLFIRSGESSSFRNAQAYLNATTASGNQADVYLTAESGSTQARLSISANSTAQYRMMNFSGDLNIDGRYMHLGTTGYIFVPVTPFHMTDTTGFAWSGGGTRNPGNYYFDANGNGNNLPAAAKAIVVLMMGTWTAANNGYNLSAFPSGGTTAAAQFRSTAANIGHLAQAIVPTNAAGDIMLVVTGAAITTPICRCIGYFL